MTKALRITSIIVAAAAVLLIILPAVFSSGMDEQTQSLLDSPGVLESLKKTTAVADTSTVSPLVQQARKFANYLNPPPPPKSARPAPVSNNRPSIRPQTEVSAKFDLLGTSYYPLRPELSLALIDEPGKGLRWIRQSSKIGHLVVEEVNDGKVVIRDGTRTYELPAKRTPKRSLIKGESSQGTQALPSDVPRTTAPPSPTVIANPSRFRRPAPRSDARNDTPTVNPPEPQQDYQSSKDFTPSKKDVIFEQFIKETEGIEDPNEWLKRADELMEQLENASQVTDEEAELLDELGKELQDANDEAASD